MIIPTASLPRQNRVQIVVNDQLHGNQHQLRVNLHNLNSTDALEIGFDGAGCAAMPEGYDVVMCFELFGGKPRLLIWADINQEDATHIIDLSGAMETRRLSDEEYDEYERRLGLIQQQRHQQHAYIPPNYRALLTPSPADAPAHGSRDAPVPAQ